MKTIKLDKLQPDPVAAALFGLEKETVTISGYICAADEETISVNETRDGSSYLEFSRSAVISAFKEEDSDQVILLINANARVKEVSQGKAETIQARRPRNEGGCGTTCESRDGSQKCCCGVGEKCVTTLSTCNCENARPSSSIGVNAGYLAASAPSVNYSEPEFTAPQDTMARGGVSGFWKSAGGYCRIICDPVVVNGKLVRYDCYYDCSRPVSGTKTT